MIGIYKIQNKQNGKIYIGQSNDIERRIKEHCYPNRYKKSRCLIDYAIHKYGVENFTYETVEECSLEELMIENSIGFSIMIVVKKAIIVAMEETNKA